MKLYTEVKTQEDMEALLNSISGFHDSMAKEFHITNRGWVNHDHSMAIGGKFDVQLLIQSQWAPYSIELVFCEMSELQIDDASEYWGAVGFVSHLNSTVEKTEIEMKFDSSLRIKSSKLFYRERPGWLGKKTFLNQEVPSDNSVFAKEIDVNWRQCQECFDAWEEPSANTFSYCNNCGKLTELLQNKSL